MRTGWEREAQWLCFDCGEHAAGLYAGATPSAAHGHADALSVLVAASGEQILADGGFSTYNGEKAWRDYFRQTRAHHTVVVDGQTQSLHLGNMSWAYTARATCEEWVSTPTFDYVCGTHNGYQRLPSPVLHRRAIFFRKPDYWLIFDELLGTGTHQVESYFHLAPGNIKVSIQAGVIYNAPLQLSLVGTPLNVAIINRNDSLCPESGWVGASYSVRLPAPVIRWHGELMLPARWVTLVATNRIKYQLTKCENAWIVSHRDFSDWYVWQVPIRNVAVGPLIVEAELCCIRVVGEHNPIQALLVKSRMAQWGRKPLKDLPGVVVKQYHEVD
jgi:hypothetical protein